MLELILELKSVLAILPKLTYNLDTWTELNDKSIKRIENLQNIFLRCLLSVPNSTPVAAMNWDSGFLSVEYRVSQKKLMLIHYLVNLDKTALASEVFEIQREHSLPGFVIEGRNLLPCSAYQTLLMKSVLSQNSSGEKL